MFLPPESLYAGLFRWPVSTILQLALSTLRPNGHSRKTPSQNTYETVPLQPLSRSLLPLPCLARTSLPAPKSGRAPRKVCTRVSFVGPLRF